MSVGRILSVLGLSLFSLTGFSNEILEFGDPDLIDVFESAEGYKPINNIILPKTPIKIEAEKGSRYAFKVGQKTYWIEGVDVETSKRVQIESLCSSTQLSVSYEVSHYGIRGAGVGCKKD